MKPENIILDENGFPHLIDFGVSYVEKDDAKNEEANKIAKQEDEEIEEVNNGNVKVDEEVLDLVDDDEVDDASVDDDGNLQL